MSLLGIDVGTTGCKSALFSRDGICLALSYDEFDHVHPQSGWAEINSSEVWEKIKGTIKKVSSKKGNERIEALCVTSLGEAVVPVSVDKKILGPSILNYCKRGEEYANFLEKSITSTELYSITGSPMATLFSMAKMMWIRDHQPELYRQADFFLPWVSFVSFMLGAEPAVDFSLANRTLLFDINSEDWSDRLLEISGLDRKKLPAAKQAGSDIGAVSTLAAGELGLPAGTPIILGAHDQCANSVGCGSIQDGQAMLGMGTFTCATPVFSRKYDPAVVIPLGVNTEHHAVKDRYVSFIYNQGGSVVKLFRDTFAALEHDQAKASGEDIYPKLFDEMPEDVSPAIVLPYFSTTGLPKFTNKTAGLITGIRLESKRGDILKGITESIIFDIKMTIEALAGTGFNVDEFITVGGGSKSDRWMQVCADILNRRMLRTGITESGLLGSAIIAGVGCGIYPSYQKAVKKIVRIKDEFTPDKEKMQVYRKRFRKFLDLRELTSEYLADL